MLLGWVLVFKIFYILVVDFRCLSVLLMNIFRVFMRIGYSGKGGFVLVVKIWYLVLVICVFVVSRCGFFGFGDNNTFLVYLLWGLKEKLDVGVFFED